MAFSIEANTAAHPAYALLPGLLEEIQTYSSSDRMFFFSLHSTNFLKFSLGIGWEGLTFRLVAVLTRIISPLACLAGNSRFGAIEAFEFDDVYKEKIEFVHFPQRRPPIRKVRGMG